MIENPILMPPVKTRRHIRQAISIRGVLGDVRRANGVNAKIAVFLTNIVGSMWCAYVFFPPPQCDSVILLQSMFDCAILLFHIAKHHLTIILLPCCLD